MIVQLYSSKNSRLPFVPSYSPLCDSIFYKRVIFLCKLRLYLWDACQTGKISSSLCPSFCFRRSRWVINFYSEIFFYRFNIWYTRRVRLIMLLIFD